MIEWGRALQVFVVGFSGVFICLILLQIGIIVFSKIVQRVERINNKGEG